MYPLKNFQTPIDPENYNGGTIYFRDLILRNTEAIKVLIRNINGAQEYASTELISCTTSKGINTYKL